MQQPYVRCVRSLASLTFKGSIVDIDMLVCDDDTKQPLNGALQLDFSPSYSGGINRLEIIAGAPTDVSNITITVLDADDNILASSSIIQYGYGPRVFQFSQSIAVERNMPYRIRLSTETDDCFVGSTAVALSQCALPRSHFIDGSAQSGLQAMIRSFMDGLNKNDCFDAFSFLIAVRECSDNEFEVRAPDDRNNRQCDG